MTETLLNDLHRHAGLQGVRGVTVAQAVKHIHLDPGSKLPLGWARRADNPVSDEVDAWRR